MITVPRMQTIAFYINTWVWIKQTILTIWQFWQISCIYQTMLTSVHTKCLLKWIFWIKWRLISFKSNIKFYLSINLSKMLWNFTVLPRQEAHAGIKWIEDHAGIPRGITACRSKWGTNLEIIINENSQKSD